MATKKRVRRGPRYKHGDDLTKRWLDRFFRSATEPWEKRRRARRSSKPRTALRRKKARRG